MSFFKNINWAKAHLSHSLIARQLMAGQLNSKIFLALAKSGYLKYTPHMSQPDCLS